MIDLSSDRNVDYTRLHDLLAARRWKSADYETYSVMLSVVGRKDGDWIRNEELLNFPCTDLRTIDSLWVIYSNGRFGFSVQKKIYLEVCGITDRKYHHEAWEKFGDRVGWRKGWWMGKGFSSYADWNDTPLWNDPPSASWARGHLPVKWSTFLGGSRVGEFWSVTPFFSCLFSRIQEGDEFTYETS